MFCAGGVICDGVVVTNGGFIPIFCGVDCGNTLDVKGRNAPWVEAGNNDANNDCAVVLDATGCGTLNGKF